MRFDDDTVVASRVFDRADGEVCLSIHKPQPDPKPELDADPDDPPWRCLYSIRFPDGETIHRAALGMDSMQALLLAFASAKGALEYVGNGTPERRPPVQWLGKDDLGLTINHFG